jgi:hypothetical protein
MTAAQPHRQESASTRFERRPHNRPHGYRHPTARPLLKTTDHGDPLEVRAKPTTD